MLGIFFVGEVLIYCDGKLLVDKFWEVVVMKLVKKVEVFVVFIYFYVKNSKFFYCLVKLNDILCMVKFFLELLM